MKSLSIANFKGCAPLSSYLTQVRPDTYIWKNLIVTVKGRIDCRDQRELQRRQAERVQFAILPTGYIESYAMLRYIIGMLYMFSFFRRRKKLAPTSVPSVAQRRNKTLKFFISSLP
jgi:hypothetical protein